MADDSLIQAIPDWVAFVRRDGQIVRQIGGRQLQPQASSSARSAALGDIWSEQAGSMLLQMIRRTLKDRVPTRGKFQQGERHFEARVLAQGPDRVLCVIREAAASSRAAERPEGVRGTGPAAGRRREFFDLLKSKIAQATLRQTPLALCMVHLDGLDAIGGTLDFGVVEHIQSLLLKRLSLTLPLQAGRAWSFSLLDEDTLAGILEGEDGRGRAEREIQRIQAALAAPVELESSSFTFTPSVGAALLGEDATRTRALLEYAGSALQEARRDRPGSICFYSQALKLRALIRHDTARELREAIDTDGLELRYSGRYELGSGRLVAVHPYLSWSHPLRGRVRAGEFLAIAEHTGMAVPLSRWALQRLGRELPKLRALGNAGARGYINTPGTMGALNSVSVPGSGNAPGGAGTSGGVCAPDSMGVPGGAHLLGSADVRGAAGARDAPALRISFRPLRHHWSEESLVTEIDELLRSCALAPEALELRIGERTAANLSAAPAIMRRLADRGIAMVIDEFGRGSSSIARLSRLPLRALQLDRSLVLSSGTDPVAFKAVRACIALASALDLVPIAAGIDSPAQRDRLRDLGCAEGLGDCFPRLKSVAATGPQAAPRPRQPIQSIQPVQSLQPAQPRVRRGTRT